ncbi:hypothetical protein Lalb_Chr09g0319691 [Lupinus albus]|uniref:Uncharacterized GPI-anchored protein At5g19230-like domain-containing protein n=1 Tax=Lupinus albus TaxID=3870 RepID=A0A6A4PYA1_LUPAL|nr:hypothetical protein Lalb_Chr09g0319691 [Lupinus albus]
MKKLLSLLFIFLLSSILLFNQPLSVHCDEEDVLLEGINKYRSSLNLTSLTENENAHCLADEIADKLKGEPCTNSTGANTVPGIGIGSEDNWIVVVLTTNTSQGSFSPATTDHNAANFHSKYRSIYTSLFFLLSNIYLF